MSEVEATADFRRILNLPRRRMSFDELNELADQMTEVLKMDGGSQKLRRLQALALAELGTVGGAFCQLDVGQGKTLPALLAAYVVNAQRPVLLLPANLKEKTQRDWAEARQHWLVTNNMRPISYQTLGLADYADALEKYEPDLIIADEVHKLKNPDAAVTRRVTRYMATHPETKFVALTGTSMRKSLRDFAHILRWCLKDQAPIPSEDSELFAWCSALDEGGVFDEFTRYDVGALLQFADPADPDYDRNPRAAARRGFRRRLADTPGVVVTGDEGEKVEARIVIRALPYELSETTDRYYDDLRNAYLTPDGSDLFGAVDVWRHSKELALGFHQVWTDARIWQWLAPILESARNKDDATVNAIAKGLEPMIALAKRSETEGDRGSIESQVATASRLATMRNSVSSKPADARFAVAPRAPKADTQGSASITTTQPDVSGGSSAPAAIEGSGFSATRRSAYDALLTTCLAVSRPPRRWRVARKAWFAFVRSTLAASIAFDSPEQVQRACDAGLIPGQHVLNEWRAASGLYKVAPVSVWHDDSALRVAARWMAEGPGLVWTEHVAFAERLSQLTGATYYGAKGQSADGRFIDDASRDEAIIVSVDANREGRNLQKKWSRNLITSIEEGADKLHQLIGRTHRTGQTEGVVTVDVLFGCIEHARAMAKAINSARSIRDTVGEENRLLLSIEAGDFHWPDEDEIAELEGWRWGRAPKGSEDRHTPVGQSRSVQAQV